ncbi:MULTISPECIES: hypothetical protein [Calothrix]|uniref:Uncharacterized protein n=2 Tax=Calothrix TaxID=1186 RepID=A0ABR8A977_9CYAN|nr:MULTISPECIES: hypothetical protein [Calothrix]MBD2196535.1 hypothetical protein [Calothrix parietina FACHB-288]MBD2227375.1 hypothetical protein [Calothrix anomala FACHB-343]
MVKVPHPIQSYSPLYRVRERTKSISGDKLSLYFTLAEDIKVAFYY